MSYDVLATEVTHRGMRSVVRCDRVLVPGAAEPAVREIVEHDDAVGVVAVDDAGRVVLLRQYRHAVGARLLELPAGTLDVEGEDPLAAARRELLEETGLQAGRWERLGCIHNSAGWSDESTTLYLAWDLASADRPAEFVLEHEEADMEVLRMDLVAAVALVHAGDVPDAKTALGLLLAERRITSDGSTTSGSG